MEATTGQCHAVSAFASSDCNHVRRCEILARFYGHWVSSVGPTATSSVVGSVDRIFGRWSGSQHNARVNAPLARASRRNPGTSTPAPAWPGCRQNGSGTVCYCYPHDSALTFRYANQVSRQFQDLTRNSPTLQCKRKLFSAGLVENPRNPSDFTQCRKLYEAHERKWSNAGRAVKTTHELPEELDAEQHFITTHGWNLIAFCSMEDGPLSFLRLPSTTSQRPTEQWTIPSFSFSLKVFAVYPPDNLLVVAEGNEQ